MYSKYEKKKMNTKILTSNKNIMKISLKEVTIFAEGGWLMLRRMDTPGSFSAILYKGDNFCDFLFPFLNTKTLL